MKKSVVILFGGQLTESKLTSVAAAGRAFDLAKIIQKAGYKPIVVGFTMGETRVEKDEQQAVYIVKRQKVSGLKKIPNFFSVNKELRATMAEIFQENDVLCLFYQSAFARLIYPTAPVAKAYGVPLGVIANDWYEFMGNVPFYLETELTWRRIYPKYHHMIVTCRYFEEYYSKRGCRNMLYIPSVFDGDRVVPDSGIVPANDGVLRIAFAGDVGGGKDRVDMIIPALAQLMEAQPSSKVELHFYGSGRDAIGAYLGEKRCLLDTLKESLFFHGFVERKKLWEELQRMDFTAIVRPHTLREERAFSTKFAESFVLGVPVIANLTSDMGEYLKDGVNGFVAEGFDVGTIQSALQRALQMTWEEKQEMRRQALLTGQKYFLLSNYVDGMKEFLQNIETWDERA